MQSFAFSASEALASIRCDWAEIEPATPREGARLVRCRKCGQIAWTRASNEDTVTIGGCGGRGKAVAGPGTELKTLIAEVYAGDCEHGLCPLRAGQMNAWGAEGCRRQRATIVAWLKESAGELTLLEKAGIAGRLFRQPWFNPLDPVGSLVDEAIRRAELKGSVVSPETATDSPSD